MMRIQEIDNDNRNRKRNVEVQKISLKELCAVLVFKRYTSTVAYFDKSDL